MGVQGLRVCPSLFHDVLLIAPLQDQPGGRAAGEEDEEEQDEDPNTREEFKNLRKTVPAPKIAVKLLGDRPGPSFKLCTGELTCVPETCGAGACKMRSTS